MGTVTLSLSDILEELRAAEEGLHKFEHRYWISSEQFYDLYSQGQLDDGEHVEDFAEWAGHYKLRQRRQAALEAISRKRLASLHRLTKSIIVYPHLRLAFMLPTCLN
jgi:hypothetical protein